MSLLGARAGERDTPRDVGWRWLDLAGGMADLFDTRMVNTGAVLVLVNREVGEKARDSYVLANGTFQHDESRARG